MSPLLLFATLATASDAPQAPALPPPRVRSIGDLHLESALHRLGLPRDQAVNTTATWTMPVEAPVRSRAEGRAQNWGFDTLITNVVQRRLHDGGVVFTGRAEGADAQAPACVAVQTDPQRPLTLQPLDSRLRGAPSSVDPDAQRLSLTVVERPAGQTLLVKLNPGESALVVEISRPETGKVRQRARQRRRIAVQTHSAAITLTPDEGVEHLCVHSAALSP